MPYPARYRRAKLIARVYEVDPLRCEHRSGQMKIIAFVIQRSEINAILNHLGLPREPPEVYRARGPPQAGLWGNEECQEITDSDATTVDDLADQDQSVSW
jgi:hypothetical protein